MIDLMMKWFGSGIVLVCELRIVRRCNSNCYFSQVAVLLVALSGVSACWQRASSPLDTDSGTVDDSGLFKTDPAQDTVPDCIETHCNCPDGTWVGRDGACHNTLAVKQLASAASHACAIQVDGSLTCWGFNGSGQCEAPSGIFKWVATGTGLSCGIRLDGTVACWGVADFDFNDDFVPPTELFNRVVTHNYLACGITTTGAIRCWGLGDHKKRDIPEGTFYDIETNGNYTCAIRDDDTLHCWGLHDGWADEQPSESEKIRDICLCRGSLAGCAVAIDGTMRCWGASMFGSDEIELMGSEKWEQVDCGFYHVCAKAVDGHVACFSEFTPDPPASFENEFELLVPGVFSTCGIRADGTLDCWGTDGEGHNVPPFGGVQSIVAGVSPEGMTCAVLQDDTIRCWDTNEFGRSEAVMPVPAPGSYIRLTIGDSYSCALHQDKTIKCWGENQEEMGAPAGWFKQISTFDANSCAVDIDGRPHCWGRRWNDPLDFPEGVFEEMHPGETHLCGMRADGTLACLGDDHSGQASPPDGAFQSLACGSAFCCALTNDGFPRCWGANDASQLEPPSDDRFVSIHAGEKFACGHRADGTIVCWGDNDWRQLNYPPKAFSQIALGGNYGCGLNPNGTVDCWGSQYRTQ